MLNVIMLSATMPNIIILSVVAPLKDSPMFLSIAKAYQVKQL
jgi:hypothetical protein